MISDVRFINEVNFLITNNGLLIKIIAEDRNDERLNYESQNN
jgi:hypothetical protein